MNTLRTYQPLTKTMEDLFGPLFNYGPSFRSPQLPTRVSFKDEADKISIFVDVPGVNKNDIQLSTEEGILSVKAKRVVENDQGTEDLELHRSFSIPRHVDTSKINAKVDNGVLTITLPKSETAQGRLIQID